MTIWRNSVTIEKMYGEDGLVIDDGRDESILFAIESLLPQIKVVLKKEQEKLEIMPEEHDNKDNMEYIVSNLDEVVEEFEWVKDAINDEEDPDEYGYSDWCEAFNNYLDYLYDIGDCVVDWGTNNVNTEKFMWVGM